MQKKENYRKTGHDLCAKCFYSTLKAIKCNQESSSQAKNPDIMNEFFNSVGPMLALTH